MVNRSQRLTLFLQTLFSALQSRKFRRPLSFKMAPSVAEQANIRVEQLAGILTNHEDVFGSESGW